MDNTNHVNQGLTVSGVAAFVPSLLVSLAVTENLFKFHSFTLEFVGFAALWGALYALQKVVVKAFTR